jgi:hypothetical protein
MTSWRRVAFPKVLNLMLTVFVLIGSCLVVALVLAEFTDWIAWEGAGLGGLAFAVVWTALAWRMRMMGLYVSDQGVRIRRHFTTRTLPWQDIEKFDVRPFNGLGMRKVEAVWVVTQEGRAHQTQVWFRPDDQPRDRVSPLLLPEARFQETLTELRGMLERSRSTA